jgi:hypothetical protein
MPNSLNISNSDIGTSSTTTEDFSISALNTDGATGQKETTWQNTKWSTQWGYFNQIADLKSAIVSKAIWNVGKGYIADPTTTSILDHIKGWGKDTFDDILFNMEITRRIGGDAYAEIIRDKDTQTIINLKPLDPSTIKIVVDDKGIIKRYEQVSKTPQGQAQSVKFLVEDIFHLSNNRLADQIHGISDIDVMEETLLAEGESFDDMKKIMHRQAKPLIMFKLGTDDPVKISAFIAKMDKATKQGDNIYIPDDANSVSYEVVQVTPSPLVLNWRDDIRNKFYRTIGLPQLIPSGASQTTESGGKIGYLSFEQVVEKDQRFLEAQIWQQLNLKINLIPPSSLASELQTDNDKDPNNFQESDMVAGRGK